jgi:hypothetical protein
LNSAANNNIQHIINWENHLLTKNIFIMKKVSILLILAAFLGGSLAFHSCKKDEVNDLKSLESTYLKAEPVYTFEIMMGQYMDIGDATLEYEYPNLIILADITYEFPEEMLLMLEETHLYIGDVEPPFAPGHFSVPEGWMDNDPSDLGWNFELGIGDECTDFPGYYYYDFGYYFALHFQLSVQDWEIIGYDEDGNPIYGWGEPYEETAWMLSADPDIGFFWMKGNKTKGWGKYYWLDFYQDCPI